MDEHAELGVFFAETDTAGNVVVPGYRIRYAMEIEGNDAVQCT